MCSRDGGSFNQRLLRWCEADLVAAPRTLSGTTPARASRRMSLLRPRSGRAKRDRQRERELGHAAVEERQPHLAAVRHAAPVGVAQQDRQARVEGLAQEIAPESAG